VRSADPGWTTGSDVGEDELEDDDELEEDEEF
jgi:hypothetical protein